MNHTSTSGCCAAGLVYNIGGAHGHFRYNNIDQFYDELRKHILSCYRVWYLFLNENQTVELAHIQAAGDTFVITKQSNLYLVSTTYSKFNEWYTESPIFAEDKRKREEEARIAAERCAAQFEAVRIERVRNGIVVRLLEGGDVVIRGPRGTESTITPKFNSGYGGHNIERIKPKW